MFIYHTISPIVNINITYFIIDPLSDVLIDLRQYVQTRLYRAVYLRQSCRLEELTGGISIILGPSEFVME